MWTFLALAAPTGVRAPAPRAASVCWTKSTNSTLLSRTNEMRNTEANDDDDANNDNDVPEQEEFSESDSDDGAVK